MNSFGIGETISEGLMFLPLESYKEKWKNYSWENVWQNHCWKTEFGEQHKFTGSRNPGKPKQNARYIIIKLLKTKDKNLESNKRQRTHSMQRTTIWIADNHKYPIKMV